MQQKKKKLNSYVVIRLKSVKCNDKKHYQWSNNSHWWLAKFKYKCKYNSYKIHINMNTSDKHFQQLVLQQISELLPTKPIQVATVTKYKTTNTSDRHFQQLLLQQISELLPTNPIQIHNNYKIHNNMNTSDKHFQRLLLQQIA